MAEIIMRVRQLGHVLIGTCPFCNKEHRHGTGGADGPDFGARIPHCARHDVPMGPGGSYRLLLEKP